MSASSISGYLTNLQNEITTLQGQIPSFTTTNLTILANANIPSENPPNNYTIIYPATVQPAGTYLIYGGIKFQAGAGQTMTQMSVRISKNGVAIHSVITAGNQNIQTCLIPTYVLSFNGTTDTFRIEVSGTTSDAQEFQTIASSNLSTYCQLLKLAN